MRGTLSFIAVAGILFLAASARALTANVTLGWNASSSSNVAGYTIYYGTQSGQYTVAVPVSNVTNVTIKGLTPGVTYYFAATSRDSSNNESAFSPEISGVAGASSVAATLTSVPTTSPGQFGFSVSGVSGGQYEVQASTDLVNWVTLQTSLAPFNFVDSNASQFSRRFYRTVYIPAN